MSGTSANALPARFLRGLAASPQGPAIRAGARSVGYQEAHETALRWGGALRAATGGRPAAIGVLTEKSVESYLAVLAVLYAGATVVPLHADFPVARTRRMLRDARVEAVAADARGLALLAEAEVDVPVLALGGQVGPGPRIPLDAAALAEPVPVEASQPCYILFTSGSTGRPKGVPITRGMIEHYFRLADARYDFTAADVFSQTFELNFDCAMFDMFCAWGAGAPVQAVPPTAYRDLPGFLAETGVTVWFSAPSVVSLVRGFGGLAPGSMPALRWSLFAGEALRASDVVDWHRAADGSTVENIYGPTELTLTVSGHRWSPETSPGLCVNGLVPIGALHAGHDFVLLAEDGTVCEGEGELCVTGPQMTPGYLDPEHDEGRFLKLGGRTWYRTGDRVRTLPGDELVYLGRLDSQVQINGMRVELAEIEHALRGCPGVESAVAVMRQTDAGPQLTAFYTGVPTPAAVLARRLGEVLPAGMLPRAYQHLPRLPLNANRKIDRRRLAEGRTS